MLQAETALKILKDAIRGEKKKQKNQQNSKPASFYVQIVISECQGQPNYMFRRPFPPHPKKTCLV